jgi:hypothetical protein
LKHLVLLLALIISIVTSFFLMLVVFFSPLVIYFYFSPPSKDVCSAVHAGITRQQIIAVVDTSNTPYSEYRDSQDRLIFRGPHSACTVRFDPSSGIAANIEKNPSGYHEFLVEAVGEY